MFRKFTATALSAFLMTATATPLLAQSTRPVTAAAGQPAAGFTIPLNAESAGHGSFTGVLRITRFATDGTGLFAIGLVTGTLLDEAGGLTSIVKNVSIPVTLPAAGTSGVKTAATCDILNLVLGPLDLNILGLQVHLNRVILDLVAVTGAGDLLGNLLCAVTNLLNGVGTLIDIVNLLNQLLSLLGG